MPLDLMFWIGVAIKMAITALFVSVATLVAEKDSSLAGQEHGRTIPLADIESY